MSSNSTKSSGSSSPWPPAAAVDPTAAWLGPKASVPALAPLLKKTYICPHCAKPFPTSQALGGHQNWHRKERIEVQLEYIRQRLEAAENIFAAFNMGFEQPPQVRARNRGGRGRGRGRGRGHGGYRPRLKNGHEAEAPSLELTLAIGGRAQRKNYMSYSFPDVLLPACYPPEGVDLTLKL